ncbi:outer membrane beta-barrel family protein [Compostibacter hankyongensis]|uniref:Outer membrane beta-barrel family protein n=1 Tax=Compostibacter hankyongensis TaxID=1007089 RepID=A0ABP8FNI0_9BACT
MAAHALGYAEQVLPVDISKDTLIHIVLKPLSRSLDELTVVDTKPAIERKADRIIFDLSNSIAAAGSNGLAALSEAPGVKISGNSISIAGKGTVSIMQDNRLLPLSGEDMINYLKSLSADQISKIEIITHPSAQYEAEGNAGLINIVTKHSDKAGFSGNIQGSLLRFMFTNPPDYGVANYGYANGSANLNYNNRRLSAYAGISYLKGRELEGYGIDVYYPGKHWAMKDTGDYKGSSFNLSGGADYALSSRTSSGVKYQFGKRVYDGADHIHVPVYNKSGTVDSVLRTDAVYYPVAYSNAFNMHLLQDIGASGGKLILNADYFNYYRHDRSDFETNSYTGAGALIPSGLKRYYDTTVQDIKVYTFKADLELPVSFAKLMMGGKVSFIDNYSNIYYYDKVDDELILNHELSNEYRYIENTQALYASGAKTAGKWKLSAGIRAEITQTTGTSYFKNEKTADNYLKLFPSFLATYTADKENSFSLTFDKRIHRPTFWDLNPYKSLMTAYSYVEGNPYLQPEYISNIELTHAYKSLLTTSFYFNIINNGFTQVTYADVDSNYIHTTPLNFIKTRRIGFSESLSFRPFRWMESDNQVNGYYTIARSGLPYISGIDGWGVYMATNNTFFFNKEKTITGNLGFWCQFPEIDHFGRSDTYYKLDVGVQGLVFKKKLSLSLDAVDVLQSSAAVIRSTVNNIHETYTNFQVFSNIKFTATWNFGNNTRERTPVKTGNEEERSRVN